MKLKSKQLIIILVIGLLLGITTALIIFSSTKIHSTAKILVDVKVSESKKLGFTIDTDALHFGELPANTEGVRVFNITNDWNEDLLVKIKAKGDMQDWISVNPDNVIIPSRHIQKINVRVKPPAGTEFGNYNGYLQVIFIKTKT